MEYILGIFALLAGFGIYNFIKRRSAEALNQNNEVKSQLNEQDKNKAKNDGLLSSEEEKRSDVKKSADERKEEPVKPDDF